MTIIIIVALCSQIISCFINIFCINKNEKYEKLSNNKINNIVNKNKKNRFINTNKENDNKDIKDEINTSIIDKYENSKKNKVTINLCKIINYIERDKDEVLDNTDIIDNFVSSLINFCKKNLIIIKLEKIVNSFYTSILLSQNENFNLKKIEVIIKRFIDNYFDIKNISFNVTIDNNINIIFPNISYKITLYELLKSFKYKKCDDIIIPVGFSSKDLSFTFKCLNKMPHLMIVGSTGTGKTSFLHLIIFFILTFIPNNSIEIFIIDPKRNEFNIYNSVNYIKAIASTLEEIEEMIEFIFNEMNRRFNIFAECSCRSLEEWNKNNRKKIPNMILIFDEFSEIININKNVVNKFYSIIRMSRTAGIYCIISTQRATADIINGNIRTNIINRISFKVKNMLESKIATGVSGAENLKKPGEILFMDADEDVHFRSLLPYFDIKDILKNF